MSLKNLKLSSSGGEREVHPRKIFDNITLRGSIKNIWDPQAEALRNWYKKRTIDDVVIEMNTGGGKTLVGLLIAQSLLHELNRRVVYVVANNQLVEQTIKRAHELAIKPASRYNFAWHRQDEFLAAETFCITNYAAVFNGYSTFKDKDIGAFIFDDAHVAEASIRDRFTLTITPDSVAFDKIVNLFKPHFSNTYGMSRLEDISEGSQTSLLFVPMYAVWKHAQELRNILVEVDVESPFGSSTTLLCHHQRSWNRNFSIGHTITYTSLFSKRCKTCLPDCNTAVSSIIRTHLWSFKSRSCNAWRKIRGCSATFSIRFW